MPNGYRTRVRLVTFNILHGRSPERDEVDIAIFAEAIASLEADVLALQEVDRNQARSGRADLTAVAAEAMGADDHLFVAALSGSPGATWTAATGTEQPDTAAYGIALLSRFPAVSWEVVRLPVVPGPAPMRFHGKRLPTLVREEPRVAVAACIDSPLGQLTVATTHLSFLPWWNGHQLRTLVRSLRAAPRPLLLTGDLNMDTAKAARVSGMRPLGARCPTFPVRTPQVQLDHVLADGFEGLVAKASVRRLPVSDHLALVVDVEAAG
ncbi:endonuclease/exonuclease/phosphatase family protein [Nocardioides sp. BP30]|uniref:endonuclease/exonuclease/phosphatase family protein n=1 Tax=Nocardioides sp. BP30 TaxID=3036374 RepID=UPI0024693C95|nr:endonuclease/exonuclease/phosphatase family protein [Nocardioides sp. BP30]WGL53832.1 endonuclease/exonuclease/phosphatase family protein [Nocardioides sp. BP30]